MKNIEPLNPDVRPDEPPVKPAAPAAEQAVPPPQNPAPIPAPAIEPTPVKPPEPDPAPTPLHESIYPTPLSMEEKRARNQQVAIEREDALKIPSSQFLIPCIVGLYALYSIVEFMKSAFDGSGLIFSFYAFSSGGTFSKILWIELLFGFILLVATLILSYKIFRGSKVALALLTGPLVVYLQTRLALYIVTITDSGPDSLFRSLAIAAEVMVEVLLMIMLVIAWTRDKKHYD